MSRWLICLLVLLSVFTGRLFASPGDQPSPDETFDFTRGPLGSHLQHEFHLVNHTASDLVIKQIAASCGCTRILSSPRQIKAGQTGIIRIDTNLNQPGRKNVIVTVTFDNGSPPHTFRIIGEVFVPPTPGA